MEATTKSAETRARILAAAMDLFRRKGFDETTMREVAAEAGMATGAAYYYFDSKDAIVLAFYDQAQKDMHPLLEQAVASTRDFEQRLHSLLEVKFRYFAPNRSLLGALAAHVDPRHPLSPFSDETREIRERDAGFFARALEDSGVRVTSDLKPYLPRLLWLYQMGLILFWIYDGSPDQRRTRILAGKSLVIVVRLVKIAGSPLMRPIRRRVVELVEAVLD